MKQANWLVVVALVVLSGLAAAQMSSSTNIRTQVPFEFVVGSKIVPAGECNVQLATMNGRTLAIRNVEAKKSMFYPASMTEGKQESANYAMVFRHYGDQYFLSGIKVKGSKIAYLLPESKAEAELRARNVSATEETLLAAAK